MTTINADAFQQMLLQLRNAYLEDIPEKLDRLDQLLVAMESAGVDASSFNECYRITHSMKGSGGVYGLHIITTICHQLEDILSATNGGTNFTKSQIAFCLKYVDLIRTALGQIHAGIQNFSEIEETLGNLRKKFSIKQFTVMIIDHSKLVTQVYLEALKDLPVRPVVMEDGLTALARLLTEPFDMLITTNEIPVLKGMALIGALKLSGAKNRNIRTVLVTSNQGISKKKDRSTDADYIFIKDENLSHNITRAAKQALV